MVYTKHITFITSKWGSIYFLPRIKNHLLMKIYQKKVSMSGFMYKFINYKYMAIILFPIYKNQCLHHVACKRKNLIVLLWLSKKYYCFHGKINLTQNIIASAF